MNSKGLNPSEILILKDLFSAESGMSVFDFHKKYKLTPLSIISFINKFETTKLLKVKDENHVLLTKKGRDWVIKNRNLIFLTPTNKYWKTLPKEKLTDPFEGCYLPDVEKIDIKFFKSLINENNGT